MKIDITKRDELNSLLNKLTEAAEAQWGLMKPQNMIEHLATTLQYSNGKKEIAQRTTEEEAGKIKQMMIYSDAEIPQGLKSPLLGELADPFEFANLDKAKAHLNNELNDFENYLGMGKLDNKEWIIFHSKHFTHHFKQFGLA